ncbi:unnamed protein product [Hermetia illucens]|uniref:Large ribosomal subunit protein bL28m n=1 Tax=Hermetia illucens TaxID=343691 RepID=A0A7R8UDR2_HERIL|nr:39S ribosomal protein L28, mitochondrial [Hermetia illucens]CAD7078837.1 unnamed protein product [Hermetia illucens]
MAACTPQGPNLLSGFKRLTRFDTGLGAQLPEAYKKFWREWKIQQPTAVHYIPKEGRWERDPVTGEVRAIQNTPLPLIFPPESDDGIWGGEGIIKGFQKRHPQKRRVPHFWVPVLRRSVVFSAILNQHMSVTVTDRAINLIHDNRGLDHYLLKTPACDLRSTLALGIKRKLLQALQEGCPALNDSPTKQKAVYSEYSKYLEQYTPEEVEWYGLTFLEAIKKIQAKIREESKVSPHKIEFRSKLIEELKKANIKAVGSGEEGEGGLDDTSNIQATSSWFSKVNPFGKKQET